MVPRWFRDGSGAATVGRPYVLRGIRMVPRWFHDGSARVPRWFRSRRRRMTIRFTRDSDGSAMVPRWFRPGSAMVPEPPPSEDHTFCEGSGWFRDGSTMVPHGFPSERAGGRDTGGARCGRSLALPAAADTFLTRGILKNGFPPENFLCRANFSKTVPSLKLARKLVRKS